MVASPVYVILYMINSFQPELFVLLNSTCAYMFQESRWHSIAIIPIKVITSFKSDILLEQAMTIGIIIPDPYKSRYGFSKVPTYVGNSICNKPACLRVNIGKDGQPSMWPDTKQCWQYKHINGCRHVIMSQMWFCGTKHYMIPWISYILPLKCDCCVHYRKCKHMGYKFSFPYEKNFNNGPLFVYVINSCTELRCRHCKFSQK